jgi:hypothetical protein
LRQIWGKKSSGRQQQSFFHFLELLTGDCRGYHHKKNKCEGWQLNKTLETQVRGVPILQSSVALVKRIVKDWTL